ncbi:HlyD family secretion protein [Celerinatantimonas diazotrophica]|uniref:Hemolysin A secretion protein HlyD n=1 Tax=Celerinatantimonas diazotrophica TaxID=412034 RepID=A0A4R1JA01_9GAMM|nr:HlyD family secretion protein [Celerinatantimonas diazotrophica]TCK47456.1 hemolysin A secretion protein HlyD [Celerinatantimonas diazotrophica]CAG9294925.1 Colistin resistance protein EmrA [Celerinatantimonas diazotrophica]
MKKVLILFAIIFVVLTGGYTWQTHRPIETDDAYVRGNITTISPKVSGQVIKIYVDDNQQVKKGQLLVQIDDQDYQKQYAQAQHSWQSANAKLRQLQSSYRYQQTVIAQVRATLASKLANLDKAQHDYQRYFSLKNSGAVSLEQFDSAQNSYKSQHALVKAEQSNLAGQKIQLKILKEQLAGAQANQQQLADAVALAKLKLSYTAIKAPIDGVIGNRSVQTGSYASIGSALFSIVPLSNLWVVANFKENQINQLHPHQSVKILVDSFNNTPIIGHIDSISPGTNASFSAIPTSNGSGNFVKVVQRIPIKIDLPSSLSLRLVPGMSATVRAITP